ncbi:MAG: DinB family protein [Chloroflexota bacterium]|nr:DinB family protein [Chloroflexota bacterium]
MVLPDDIRERVTSYIKHQATKSPEFLVDFVRVSQERYLDAVGSAGEELSLRKPAPGEWSLRELTRHVIDAQSSVRDIVAMASRGEKPPARGGAGMMGEDDGRPFAQLVDELRALDAQMLDAIRDLPAVPDTAITPPHPFFGPLNCLEWAAFQRVHDEDHVQHAGKILAAVG